MTQKSQSRPLAEFAPALFLLTVSFIINYVDRGNISVAGPLIKHDFGLSESELGVLFSAFFFTYTAMQFLIGWLVDRFNANWILVSGFLLWSLATATTGIVRGFALLLVIRFILGIGESVALPCGSKILAQNLPEHYRGFASGCLMSGLKWGNVIGTIGAGFLMADFGWRPIFIAVGLISLLWLPAWVKCMPRCDRPSLDAIKLGPGFWDILSQRSFWGTSAGHFATNYLFYFLLTGCLRTWCSNVICRSSVWPWLRAFVTASTRFRQSAPVGYRISRFSVATLQRWCESRRWSLDFPWQRLA